MVVGAVGVAAEEEPEDKLGDCATMELSPAEELRLDTWPCGVILAIDETIAGLVRLAEPDADDEDCCELLDCAIERLPVPVAVFIALIVFNDAVAVLDDKT